MSKCRIHMSKENSTGDGTVDCITLELYAFLFCRDCGSNAVALMYTVKLRVLTHAGFFRLLMKGICDPYVL